jgi:prepilin-type N-terminal cleavage/methylation domain-containing protein
MKKRAAFSLVEVMVVIAVLVIIGAIAYPSLEAMQSRFSLDSSIDQIKARWAECRAHAIEEGQAYRFGVKPNSSQFRCAPDSAEYWDGGGAGATQANTDVQPLVVEESVEKDVLFRMAEGSGGNESGGYLGVVVFLPDGTCKADASIQFEVDGGKPTTLKIRALTGIITTSRDTAEAR